VNVLKRNAASWADVKTVQQQTLLRLRGQSSGLSNNPTDRFVVALAAELSCCRASGFRELQSPTVGRRQMAALLAIR